MHRISITWQHWLHCCISMQGSKFLFFASSPSIASWSVLNMRIHPSIYPCHWLVVRSFIWRIVLWNHFDRRLEKQQSEKRKQWKVILGPGGLPATVTYWERKLLVGKHRCGTVVGSQAWPRKNRAVQNTKIESHSGRGSSPTSFPQNHPQEM